MRPRSSARFAIRRAPSFRGRWSRLKNTATGIAATTTSDQDGNYQFLNVRVGNYSVRAELQGFSAAEADSFAVVVNARQRVDLTLQVGNVGETVVVSGAATLLESESSERGTIIDKEQIVNLPLNGRAYADLALLSPGVRRSAIADSRDASFNVNGLRSAVNSFILDGVDNNSYGTSNQGFSNQVVQVSPDAVEQFKVETNNFSAEFGRTGGAVINASMRSGTNAFRGTVWEFNRNTALNAVGFFKPTSGVKPKLQRNQFGGVFGGPIVRNRTFFFADYEGFRQISRTVTFASIPTLAQREGNLGKPIQNPLTGEIYADGVIPSSAITAFAKKVLAGLPAPTAPGISNNFDSLPRRQDFNDKFDVKVDHQFSSRMTMFVRVSHRKVNNFEPSPIPGPTGSPSNAFVHVLNDQGAVGFTITPTPASLFEARLGISRTEAGKEPQGVGSPGMLEAYGISGLPTDPRFAGGLTEQGVTGWTTWGRQNSNPQFQDPSVLNPRINYSWVKGAQSFKTGYEYQAINTKIDDFNPKYGRDSYGGQFSRPADATGSDPATYNLADFMFGARNAYSIINPFIANLRQRMHFAYLQDDMKVARKLTLNLGLRYEYATPQWEKDNFLTNYDPVSNTLISAKDGSIYDRALVNPDRNNFAPRVGLAFAATDKTIIRSGYGVSYIHFNRMGGENLLSFNGPHVVGGEHHAAAVAGAVRSDERTDELFPHDAAGIPGGADRSGELQSAQRAGQLHPAGQSDRERSELARVGSARNPAEPARRHRLRRQQELEHHDPGRLQPGATKWTERECFAPGTAADPGIPGNPGRVGRRQGGLPGAAVEGRAPLLPGPLLAELVHVFARAGQRVRASRGAEWRQQPRELSRSRQRIRQVRVRPAAEQHDQLRVGAAVWPGSQVRGQPEPGARGGARGMARRRHQHHDERRSDQPVLRPVVDVQREREPDLPAEPHRRSRHAQQRAHDQQLSE